MSDDIEEKIKNYRTAPFDARFPNTNQTRNCYQNYLGKQDNLLHSVSHSDLVHTETLSGSSGLFRSYLATDVEYICMFPYVRPTQNPT